MRLNGAQQQVQSLKVNDTIRATSTRISAALSKGRPEIKITIPLKLFPFRQLFFRTVRGSVIVITNRRGQFIFGSGASEYETGQAATTRGYENRLDRNITKPWLYNTFDS